MLKVLTAEQMREVDRLTTERYGIPSIILMENAAHAVARVITEKLGGSVKGKSILILCGKGNNGGDGAALARILWTQGAEIYLQLFGEVKETRDDARANFDVIQNLAQNPLKLRPFLSFDEKHRADRGICRGVDDFDVIVDAIFGTGLSRLVDAHFYEITSAIGAIRQRSTRPLLISIDLPSGLKSDGPSEEFELVFFPDSTVTFTAPKAGSILPSSYQFCGELIVKEIGSPQVLVDEQPSQLYLAEQSDAANWLSSSKFSIDSYKNKRGHALVIAGSEDYSGAAILAGNAAMRSGVGLVTLAVPKAVKSEVAARALPDLIVRPFDGGEFEVNADAILIGCGLDANDSANEAMFHKVVEERASPVIVDAGALWFVPGRNAAVRERALKGSADESGRAPLILTPHEGEFLRLLDAQWENNPVDEASPPLLSKEGSLKEDRVAAVREYATANNVILVLKGERVLIGAPDGRVVVNPTGNSGLGKAGNGDTLAGILVGFVAQAAKMDIDIFETVVAAVYIAGMAGDVAEKKYGKRVMTASDVRECLVDVFSELENG